MPNTYLSDEILKGFSTYKYSSVDTSPLSKYVMHPFWDWLTSFYPMWLAPNLLTLGGFLLQVMCLLIVTYYDPHMLAANDSYPEHPPVPNIAWLLCAFFIFGAHQLDGTDGKQARRTGASGPLGELFDHGLDSWATFFMPAALLSVYGRDGYYSVNAVHIYFVLIGVWICFILSHWEKYNTGILYLPWAYDLSQLSIVLLFLITYFGGGHDFWKFDFPFTDWPCAQVLEVGLHSTSLLSVFISIFNVYRGLFHTS